MAKFVADSPEEMAKLLDGMEAQIDKLHRTMGTSLGKAVVKAGQLIEARAKEIITEKGHIVTGALRRSINTQPRLSPRLIEARIGSPLEYAPKIEALPDGGFLGPAAEQRAHLAIQVLFNEGVLPRVQEWGRATEVKGGGTIT